MPKFAWSREKLSLESVLTCNKPHYKVKVTLTTTMIIVSHAENPEVEEAIDAVTYADDDFENINIKLLLQPQMFL